MKSDKQTSTISSSDNASAIASNPSFADGVNASEANAYNVNASKRDDVNASEANAYNRNTANGNNINASSLGINSDGKASASDSINEIKRSQTFSTGDAPAINQPNNIVTLKTNH